MDPELLKQVKELLNYLQKAFNVMGLKELLSLTPTEIEQFRAGEKFIGKVVTFNPKNKNHYQNVVGKILDYFIFNATIQILEFLNKQPKDRNVASLALDVNKILESSGSNTLARFLGERRFPEFVDEEKIYKKMLWLEWLIVKFLKFKELNNLAWDDLPKKQIVSQFNMRYDATKDFLKKYAEAHLGVKSEIEEFRKSYHIADFKLSYDAAFKALNPVVTLKDEKKASPVLVEVKKVEQIPLLPAMPVVKTEVVASLPQLILKPAEVFKKQELTVSVLPVITLQLEAIPVKLIKEDSQHAKDENSLAPLKRILNDYKTYLVSSFANANFKYICADLGANKLMIINQLLAMTSLREFRMVYAINKPILIHHRDTKEMLYAKRALTAVSLGFAALFGLWNVRGEQMVKQIDAILKRNDQKVEVSSLLSLAKKSVK